MTRIIYYIVLKKSYSHKTNIIRDSMISYDYDKLSLFNKLKKLVFSYRITYMVARYNYKFLITLYK